MPAEYYSAEHLTKSMVKTRAALLIGVVAAASSILTIWIPQLGRLALAAAAAALVAISFRPNIIQILLAITLLTGLVPLAYRDYVNLAFSSILLVNLLGLATKLALNQEQPLRNKALEWFILLHIGLAAVTMLSAVINSTPILTGLADAARQALYAGLIWLIYYEITSIEKIKSAISTIIAIVMVMAVILYKYAYELGVSEGMVRLGITMMRNTSSWLANPNAISTIITFPLPFLFAYLIYYPGKRWKWASMIALVFLLPAWFSINSRANYLILTITLLTLISFHKNRKLYLIVAIIIIAIILLTIFLNLFPLLNMILRLEGGVTYRDSLWDAAWRMTIESPILGKGPGFYDKNKFYYMDPDVGRQVVGTWPRVSPHSVPLLRAVDTGILGVLLQVTIWILPVIALFKGAKQLADYKHKYIFLAIGSMWMGLTVKSLFDAGASVIFLILIPALYKIPLLARQQQND